MFVTGLTGFVGRHLRAQLEAEGAKVLGTCFPEHAEEAGCVFYLDLRSEAEVRSAVRDARPDRIVHLAALSNVGHSWERRTETLETNLMGTYHLLEAVRSGAPGARVLLVSSSDVYGVHGLRDARLREDHPTQAVSPYAYTKICAELLAGFYARVETLNVVVARPFPHTGPGQSPDFVCSDWASQIARIERGAAEPVIRVGNVDVERDFLDVRDVVRAYLALLDKGRAGEVYNIASGHAVSLRWILDSLLAMSGEPIRVEADAARFRKVDIPTLTGDNEKIRAETGWEPRTPLGRTLRDLLEDRRARAGSAG
ncbi:MAG: GDP-mannose 4,6-dehydratase [Candidatus Aminicenantes bacterium]|nr:GDP-mannose 4,6-dehydratase [Candidatus Aminicenantes bacterium]